jgi:Xaa-Pro aminopeptidase
MSDAVVLFGDSERSMDLFHSVPVAIIDPFLYTELGDRRIAVIGHIDHQTIAQVDPGIELLDPLDFGRRQFIREGADYTTAGLLSARRALSELGVTRATVSWDFPTGLADLLREGGIDVVVDAQAIQRRRRVKSEPQVEGARRAQRAADAAMGVAARLVRECEDGLTSEAVRRAMQAAAEERDCLLPDDVIVAVNGQAANGHDSGSGPIRAGDVVLIDIWPRDRRSLAWADMTRTFIAAGEEPSEEIAEYWRLAREALEKVVAEVRPGINGRRLYDIASGVFEAAGHPTMRSIGDGPLPPNGFLHGLGHGVGLEVHEMPSLGLAGDDLVAGDVIAVEPGCYRQGVGGVRLEDLLLVTSAGCEVLTDFPYEL